MEIILLGSGNLGNSLKSFFSGGKKIKILPLRTTSLEYFVDFSRDLSSSNIIFDLMDPNKIDNSTEYSLLKKAFEFRKIISKSNFIKQYLYFSTANLYTPSLKIIFETSKVISKTNSEYLSLKKSSENLLSDLNLPLSICRIPNIWGQPISNSFFSDLIKAHKKGTYIEYRKGDDEVISYINLNDLCNLLYEILKKEYLGIINLSTDSFDSRQNLKSKVNKDKYKSIQSSLGIRLSSGILDWKKIIKRSDLPL